jgi:hypothetical protein
VATPTEGQASARNAGVVFFFLADWLILVLIVWGVDWLIGGVSHEDRTGYITWLRHVTALMAGAFTIWVLSIFKIVREKRKARREALLRAMSNLSGGGTIGRPRPSSKPVVIRADVTDLPRRES